MRRSSWVWGGLLAFAALLLAPEALAQRVVLVEPGQRDPVVREAYHRIRTELLLSAFEVSVIPAREAVGRAELEAAAAEYGAVAVVSISGAEGSPNADVWVADAVTGKTSVRTITPTGGRGAEVLAVRAVELLRTSLREIETQQPSPDVVGAHPERAVPSVRQWAAPPAAPPKSAPVRFALDAGAGAWSLGDAFTLAPVASLAVAWQPVPRFGVRLCGVLSVAPARTEAARASADADTTLALLELRGGLLKQDHFELVILGGAGIQHTRASGTAELPYVGQRESLWAAALSPGAEAGLPLSARAALRLNVRAPILLPRSGVHLEEEDRWLRTPLLLSTLNLSLAF
jgi:hypothetical protein